MNDDDKDGALIIRSRDTDWSTVSNIISRDSRATLKARGLHFTIMTLPDDWKFNMKGLISILKEGKDAVYTAINELIALGYCERGRIVKRGKIVRWTYTFYDKPKFLLPGFPDVENPEMDFPVLDFPDKEKPDSNQLRQRIKKNVYNARLTREDRASLTKAIELYASFESSESEASSGPKSPSPPHSISGDGTQQDLFDHRKKSKSKKTHNGTIVRRDIVSEFTRICFLVRDERQARILTSSQLGQVSGAIRKLELAGADLTRLPEFELWWASNFRSKDKQSGIYQPPRPTQIQELWFEAMHHRDVRTAKSAAIVEMQDDETKKVLEAAYRLKAQEKRKK